MTYAVVITNLLDMRKSARFQSERVNQLLFGEPIEILGSRTGFVRVRKQDGYVGWCDAKLITPVSIRSLKKYSRELNWVVASKTTPLFGAVGKGKVSPYFVYYGTRLAVAGRSKGLLKATFPDGRAVCVREAAVRRLVDMGRRKPSGRKVVTEATRFLGVPFLWGGITPSGFDCSGMLQIIFSRLGHQIPRDTKDQVSIGRRVDREEVRRGDLLFFDRHVGLALSRDRIIHCSVEGGGVRINTLRSGQQDYREDLDRSYREARRI